MEYGLLGKKLGHSFSKVIHEAIGKYNYDLIELTPCGLDEFLKNKNFKAVNVTMPYKKDVIKYLDYIDPVAKDIDAVNCIVNNDGKLYGYNTDYLGLLDMIKYYEIDVKDKKCFIFGTGATSRTAHSALKTLGAKEITHVGRHSEDEITYADLLDEYVEDVEIILNTTPCEMYPNNTEELIDISRFPNLKGVIDVVYNPLRTNLCLSASSKGIKNCNGLYMLVSQAVYGINLFKGLSLDSTVTSSFFKVLVKTKENIVLIGMPGCGKTTIGKMIAERLNRPFIDVDEEIVKKINMPISDYFKEYGEASFRDIEESVINEICKLDGVVISTGGGSILRSKNIKHLKQNGRIYFLDRDLDKLEMTSSRPLSSNINDLTKRYNERIDIYRASCDVRISANSQIIDAVNNIINDFNL